MTLRELSVKQIVERLFSNGRTPCDFYGINGEKIQEVESRYPHVAKQYPRSIV